LFKSLIAGILLGLAASAALLHFVPVVDQHRERSIISVATNGGNIEEFHVNVPTDRILTGAAGQQPPLPPGLEWPADPFLAGTRVELFKIRNANDMVVGVASRIAATGDQPGDVIEWVVHLPARGSLYVTMQTTVAEGGYRVGNYRAGTREFGRLRGRVTERFVADEPDANGMPTGRIELVTTFVAEETEES
jgi:hypothetical protein